MNNYKNTMARFGIDSNLPDPQFEKPISRLSDGEYAFLLSEKKWQIDNSTKEAAQEDDELSGLIAEIDLELSKDGLDDDIKKSFEELKAKATAKGGK